MAHLQPGTLPSHPIANSLTGEYANYFKASKLTISYLLSVLCQAQYHWLALLAEMAPFYLVITSTSVLPLD